MAIDTEASHSLLHNGDHSKKAPGWLRRLAWPSCCLVVGAVAFFLGTQTGHGEPDVASEPAVQGQLMSSGLWNPRVPPVFLGEPLAKDLIRRFDLYLMNAAAFDKGEQKVRTVGQWLAPDFKYETVGFPSSYTLEGWTLSGEEQQFRTAFPTSGFSQMLFFGTDDYATTTSYGNVRWHDELFGIPPPKEEWTYFRVTDFYSVRKTGPNSGLVNYNFMVIDWADLFRRVGRPVLPPAALPEGLVLSAHVNDGVPAPLSVVARGRDHVTAKKAMEGALFGGWAGDEPASKWWQKNMTFYGPGGIGLAQNAKEFQQHVLDPYHAAFTNRSVEASMLFCEGNYCGAYGNLLGDHVGTWVGLPASSKRLSLRFCMHFRVVEGLISEGWAIFDFPGLFNQLGLDFYAKARDQTPLPVES